MSRKPKCKHTSCPEGYIAWHEWAGRKARTFDCVQCPGCGLFNVWKRKKKTAAPMTAPAGRGSEET